MGLSQTQSSIFSRMFRAARLEEAVYEEVEHDRDATRQAALVVVGTSIAAGIGAGFAGDQLIAGLIFMTIAGLVAWAIYAYITYFIGTRVFAGPETQADWGELARTLGFANAPRALLIVGVVPALFTLVGFIVSIWVLATTVVALRAALDFTIWRAVGTAIVGWVVQVAVLSVIFALLF